MKVTLSTPAKRDLEGIRRYIEKDNPGRAISFVGVTGPHRVVRADC